MQNFSSIYFDFYIRPKQIMGNSGIEMVLSGHLFWFLYIWNVFEN